jgi:hypothetical protein
MFASEHGRTEALSLLLASGANVNAALQALRNMYLL